MRRTMRNLSLFLILACALAGCMVGPDYRRPLVDTPGAWRFEAGEAKDVVNTPWWKQFQDPVLDSLIGRSIRDAWACGSRTVPDGVYRCPSVVNSDVISVLSVVVPAFSGRVVRARCGRG